MVAPELLQYITQNKAAGFTEEQIQNALRAAGWAEEMISEAFSSAATISGGGIPLAQSTSQQQSTGIENELTRIQNELEQAKKGFHAHADPEAQSGRGLTGLLIRRHIVRSEAQANIYMIAVSLICISASVWLLLPKSNSSARISPALVPSSAPGAQK
jgi:hypothetical protein